MKIHQLILNLPATSEVEQPCRPEKIQEKKENIESALQMLYKIQVEARGREFIADAPTLEKLNLAAKWLSSSQKFGLVLYGNVGSGKTMLLNSLAQLFYRIGCSLPHIINTTAAELHRYYVPDLCAGSFYAVAKNCKILLLDDLGCEPENCIIYGTSYHPISEIIYHRYRNQLTTILTTNLTDNELASRYGPRIMDRLEESFDFIAYTNPSYRKRK